MAINVVRLIMDPNIQDMDLWSRVEFNDRQWDVVTPPGYHHGTRHTRHWSIDVRERPWWLKSSGMSVGSRSKT